MPCFLIRSGYQQPQRPTSSRTPVWVVTLLTIFVVLDIFIYFRISHSLLGMGTDSAELPVRYPYIGLDEMYSSTDVTPSKFDPLVNVPVLATQISRAEPDRVFPVDTHQWLSDFGTLSPPDRNLRVSGSVSSAIAIV